jgi:hypothetical protein
VNTEHRIRMCIYVDRYCEYRASHKHVYLLTGIVNTEHHISVCICEQVFDSGDVTEDGPQDVVEKIKRAVDTQIDEFKAMAPEEDPLYEPEEMESGTSKFFSGLKEQVSGAISSFGSVNGGSGYVAYSYTSSVS